MLRFFTDGCSKFMAFGTQGDMKTFRTETVLYPVFLLFSVVDLLLHGIMKFWGIPPMTSHLYLNRFQYLSGEPFEHTYCSLLPCISVNQDSLRTSLSALCPPLYQMYSRSSVGLMFYFDAGLNHCQVFEHYWQLPAFS